MKLLLDVLFAAFIFGPVLGALIVAYMKGDEIEEPLDDEG